MKHTRGRASLPMNEAKMVVVVVAKRRMLYTYRVATAIVANGALLLAMAHQRVVRAVGAVSVVRQGRTRLGRQKRNGKERDADAQHS